MQKGKFYYNWCEGRVEYHTTRPAWDYEKVKTCPCCVNKQRSRVKAPKAVKIRDGSKGMRCP